MKVTREHTLVLIAVIGWSLIAWVVVDYNLGLGSTTLRWLNPAYPTAAWTWDTRETTPTTIEANSGQWLRVTLPRGFAAGTLQVKTTTASSIILKAEVRDGQTDIAQTSQGLDHAVSFAFTNLIARGRTFRFRVENPTSNPVTITTISMTVTR